MGVEHMGPNQPYLPRSISSRADTIPLDVYAKTLDRIPKEVFF